MKILWHTHLKPSYILKLQGKNERCGTGGWFDAPLEYLKNRHDIELLVCYPVNGGDEEGVLGNICYVGISYDMQKMAKGTLNENHYRNKYRKLIDAFSPDVIHIHGTEFQFSLFFYNAAYACGFADKVVISVQGLVGAISRDYVLNVPSRHEYVRYITLSDIVLKIKGYNIYKNFRNRGKCETDLIKKARFFIGRTSWDEGYIYINNPNAIYYHCCESLRRPFYMSEKWNASKSTKHSIYMSQAFYPLKGLHYLISALTILRDKYADLKVIIAGGNILQQNRLKGTPYGIYIKKLIRTNKLDGVISFVGPQTAEQVKIHMLKSNVYVCPSALENSPNSLGEAMMLGMPCVCSNVGGVADMATHRKEALLYPLNETYMLAYYVAQIFESDELAESLGNAARERALKTHDVDKNNQTLLDIYRKIMNDAK